MKVIIYLFCSSIVWCYSTSYFYFSNFYNITTSLKDETYKYKDYDTFSSLDFNSLFHSSPDLDVGVISFDYRNKSKFLDISFMPIIVNKEINQIAFGSSYSRLGLYGRIEKSFLKAYFGNNSIKIGRGNHKNKLDPHSSILDSGFYPSKDEFSFKTKKKNYLFEFSFGQLSNEKDLDNKLIKRNFGKHSLTLLGKKSTSIEFGEMIIYTGINRNLELVYMNPFLPYFLNGLEIERKDQINDNDNSMLYFTLKSKYRNVNYYYELIIDDFQIDDTGGEHAIGFKLGLHKIKPIGLSWILEYINIDKWVYLHHGNFTSWQNNGKSVGYSYGPDSKAIRFQGSYNWNDYIFYFELQTLVKGLNNINTNWNNLVDSGYISKKDSYLFNCLSIIKKTKHFRYEIGWNNQPIENEINGHINLSKTNNQYFLKLIFDKGILFQD